MDCENCRHLTVVGLHGTGPRASAVKGKYVPRKLCATAGEWEERDFVCWLVA